jgi:translocation and assembly module TamA
MRRRGSLGRGRVLALLLCVLPITAPPGAGAATRMAVDSAEPGLEAALKAASLLVAAPDSSARDPHEVLASASADYARLVDVLYRHGYYGGVVSIRLDGREAGGMSALGLPARIGDVDIRVDPGPLFRFGTVAITPEATGTALPTTFRAGEPALLGTIRDALAAALDAWREAGHATADVAGRSIVADHRTRTLNVRLDIAPGPEVRFGSLRVTTPSGVRADRIRRIADLPEGALFTPSTLERSARRLRRTEAFSTVTLTGTGQIGPGSVMDVTAAVTDQKPRRFGLGAEVSPSEGGKVSGFWLHRNLLGGAERFRVTGEIANIGGQTSGIDGVLGFRLGVPAVLGGNTNGYATAVLKHLDETDFRANSAAIGVGVTRIISDDLEVSAGLGLGISATTDSFGTRTFRLVTLPATGTLDRRSDRLDPGSGVFLGLDAKPFYDVGSGAAGLRLYADGRAYRTVGRTVLAARLQTGLVAGAGLTATPPDFLFYSGGGNTVRGQPYQSLAVDLGGGLASGGRSFLALSAEARLPLRGAFGAVVFADAGFVGPGAFYAGGGAWHAGAGLGLRYKTGVGPIRLDLAVPVAGATGAGWQLYLGIGQAF